MQCYRWCLPNLPVRRFLPLRGESSAYNAGPRFNFWSSSLFDFFLSLLLHHNHHRPDHRLHQISISDLGLDRATRAISIVCLAAHDEPAQSHPLVSHQRDQKTTADCLCIVTTLQHSPNLKSCRYFRFRENLVETTRGSPMVDLCQPTPQRFMFSLDNQW